MLDVIDPHEVSHIIPKKFEEWMKQITNIQFKYVEYGLINAKNLKVSREELIELYSLGAEIEVFDNAKTCERNINHSIELVKYKNMKNMHNRIYNMLKNKHYKNIPNTFEEYLKTKGIGPQPVKPFGSIYNKRMIKKDHLGSDYIFY